MSNQVGQISRGENGEFVVTKGTDGNGQVVKSFNGGAAGPKDLQNAMVAAGYSIQLQQDAMADLMGDGISAEDVAKLNEYNNNISLLSSAQKSLNNAQGAAQKMIAA